MVENVKATICNLHTLEAHPSAEAERSLGIDSILQEGEVKEEESLRRKCPTEWDITNAINKETRGGSLDLPDEINLGMLLDERKIYFQDELNFFRVSNHYFGV